jgi:hypothetical protein
MIEMYETGLAKRADDVAKATSLRLDVHRSHIDVRSRDEGPRFADTVARAPRSSGFNV